MNIPSPQPSALSPSSALSPLFVLVAGESSGDLLGADLIAGLRQRFPKSRFAGVGGPLMAAAGMEIWHRAEELSVMGLVEVLRHLPRLLALRRDVYRRTMASPPAVFVGIDAPDFNLDLERKLKAAGVRTAHYVSPSIWAWREKRAAKIGRSADRVLCLFPMEPPIYARYGVDARFVGHPLAAMFPAMPDKAAARAEIGLAADAPVLAMLPGSRLGEIRRLSADFLEAGAALKKLLPDLQIIAPMANAKCRGEFEARIGSAFERSTPLRQAVRVIDGNAHHAMMAADAVLLASGTAALEAMLAKRPMVVAYRLAPWTYRIVRTFGLMRTRVYSLPNILAGKVIVAELMQDQCTPEALAATLAPMLRARELDPGTLAEFTRLHESLRSDAEHTAAGSIAELLPA
jgi:lipid-A-disaccharide synthase